MSQFWRRIKWCSLYVWVWLLGVPVWVLLFVATPVMGAFPKSPTVLARTSRRHAVRAYGAW